MGRWDSQTPTPRLTRTCLTGIESSSTAKSKWDETPITQRPAATSQNTLLPESLQANFFPSNISAITRRESFWLSDEYMESILPHSGFEITKLDMGSNEPNTESINISSINGISLSSDELDFFKCSIAPFAANPPNEIKTLKLLFQLKKGTFQERKTAMKLLVSKCEELNSSFVVQKLVTLLMQTFITEQERHIFLRLLLKLISKLDARIEPFCAQILIIAEPLLLDNDYFVRCEGKELLSTLAKNVGIMPLLHIFRQDMEHSDERVRITTCRAFSVVSLAVGLENVEKFLLAIISSKKSPEIRQSGLKAIQYICLSGASEVSKFCSFFLKCIFLAIRDDSPKVQMAAFLALSSLLDIMNPYGFELIEHYIGQVIQILLLAKGKLLVASIKSLASIFSLSGALCSEDEARNVLTGIITRCFDGGDFNSRKICINSLSSCLKLSVFRSQFFSTAIYSDFKENFLAFIQSLTDFDRILLNGLKDIIKCCLIIDPSSSSLFLIRLLNSTTEMPQRVSLQILSEVRSPALNVEYRQKVVEALIECFVRCTSDDVSNEVGFSLQCTLGVADGQFLDWENIGHVFTSKLQSRDIKSRSSASIVLGCIASANEGKSLISGFLRKMAGVLYENLDEDDPKVLAFHIDSLNAVFNALSYELQLPSLKDVTLRIAAILRNRNEKVQESSARFLGKVATMNPDVVSIREWMRVCFELIDLLGTSNKMARREAMTAFGAISKAIGPSDLLIALLNNLKVQERQNRLCTTIAIAVVAQSCSPFTVLASLMNEYRIPEQNVQNGVLKAVSFLFEYCGFESQVYGYSLCSLLEDALSERDLVHRQIACNVMKHLSICSLAAYTPDLFFHLFNYVWPNILETAPHVLMSVIECIDSVRINLGPGVIHNHTVQGLFHPARKIREVYWRIYNNIIVSSQDSVIPSLDSDLTSGGPIDVVF